jgi:hypothetical protein
MRAESRHQSGVASFGWHQNVRLRHMSHIGHTRKVWGYLTEVPHMATFKEIARHYVGRAYRLQPACTPPWES